MIMTHTHFIKEVANLQLAHYICFYFPEIYIQPNMKFAFSLLLMSF